MTDYLENLEHVRCSAASYLRAKGIDERYLAFTDVGDVPQRALTVPTDVRSEFLANRAMGDWAEDILANAFGTQSDRTIVRYGDSDTIAAGEEGFRNFYLSRLDDVRQYGKRPDLLMFASTDIPTDASGIGTEALMGQARLASCAIEVRSSKFEAQKYMQARTEEWAQGRRGIRMSPSFTVKVEDLIIVHRWLRHHAVPQFYVQVFFDSAYCISVLDIFAALRDRNDITIEKNANNQLKATIHIPITQGVKIGVINPIPEFQVKERVTRLGRHDAYVEPVGGQLTLDPEQIRTVGLV
ncbi:MAG: AccI family restriction endonuclease [Pseudomonadota bacterium]